MVSTFGRFRPTDPTCATASGVWSTQTCTRCCGRDGVNRSFGIEQTLKPFHLSCCVIQSFIFLLDLSRLCCKYFALRSIAGLELLESFLPLCTLVDHFSVNGVCLQVVTHQIVEAGLRVVKVSLCGSVLELQRVDLKL